MRDFEILCGAGHLWISALDFNIPEGAVAVGVNKDDHKLYIGRCRSVDKTDKSQHMQLVSVNPCLRSLGELNNDRALSILDHTCQLLIEAPPTLKLTDADLQGSSYANAIDAKTLSISKHLANKVKVRH